MPTSFPTQAFRCYSARTGSLSASIKATDSLLVALFLSLVHATNILFPVRSKECQHRLVPPCVLLLHTLVAQIRPRRHPPVDLVTKGLDVLRRLGQRRLELRDVLSRLVLGRQHGQRNRDVLCVSGVDHSRMALGTDLEGVLSGGGS